MRNRWVLLFAGFCFIAPPAAGAEGLDLDRLKILQDRFPFALVVNHDDPEELRLFYADVNQHVHLYALDEGKLVLEWETTNLASSVTSMFIRDLDRDGNQELVFTTRAGRILIYNAETYELLWENLQDPFEEIDCMTAQNIDSDPQDELIFVADSYLYIYDSTDKSLEWQSQQNFEAREIVVDNVDDDEPLEIILNTGVVIDARFHNVEFEIDEKFGERICLFDFNNDGILEIVGEFDDFTLKIYDIYAEREIW